MARVLVTGAAGFIGFHLSRRLLERGDEVVGLDNLNEYYDVRLKQDRLKLLEHERFEFHRLDLADTDGMADLFSSTRPELVVNLAAQAGVRYSLLDPHAYIDANIKGFLNVLEGCRHHPVRHLVYASSSSVYGANTRMPFSVHDNIDHPVSLYAASKKANELMAHTYANLFGLHRPASVSSPSTDPGDDPTWRCSCSPRGSSRGRPIDVYNRGKMKRDFTYVDDIVEGVIRVMDRPAEPNPDWSGAAPDPATSFAPWRVYNIGNHDPVNLMDFIRVLEKALGRKAELNLMPLQPGDVRESFADVDDLMEATGFRPATPIDVGIRRFVEWYLDYHR